MYNEGIGGAGTCVFNDLDRMRLTPEELAGLSGVEVIQEVQTDVQNRRRSRGAFICGPLPLALVCATGKLPGKALLVWLLVNYRVRVVRQSEVTLPNALLATAGVNPRAKARALVALERAGLVRVRRELGKTARIALTTPPSH